MIASQLLVFRIEKEEEKLTRGCAFKKGADFGVPLLLIEDMDLRYVDKGSNFDRIIVVPWAIKDIDSAPCTVLAEIFSISEKHENK